MACILCWGNWCYMCHMAQIWRSRWLGKVTHIHAHTSRRRTRLCTTTCVHELLKYTLAPTSACDWDCVGAPHKHAYTQTQTYGGASECDAFVRRRVQENIVGGFESILNLK